MGSASLLTLTNLLAANAQQVAQTQMAQAAPEAVPEQVLITGSLIHGTAAVGVPVTNLSVQDFRQTGALTTADLFRTIPVANVSPGAVATNSGGHLERETRVNIRGLDQTGPRSLLMVDGMRFPPQADGICAIDPSIIPALALDRIDILADGASATYGSDAIAGVINIILKRGFDGAVTQLNYSVGDAGGDHFQAAQLWGRTWNGGDITLSYEWYDEAPVLGTSHSKYTANYTPWGLDDRTPLGASLPGVISATGFGGSPTAAPWQPPGLGLGTAANFGTNCANCFAIPAGTGLPFNPINGGIGPLAPFSGSTLNWTTFNTAANSGTNGTRNEFDPFFHGQGYEVAPQQRNAATLTIDQRLTRNISFYGSAFYSNRRVEQLVAEGALQVTNDLLRVAVPTFNPYYPTGGAPAGLRVAYDLAKENPPHLNAYELSHRYAFGLNIDLPGDWHGQIYDSRSYDSNRYNYIGGGPANVSAVSAALGWTIGVTPASGTTPAIASWSRPSTVPYLNLFCDPRTIQCNSPVTLNYVNGTRYLDDIFTTDERGARFDGSLFDVPAGQVKAAVGGTYTSFDVIFHRGNNSGSSNLILQNIVDSQPYNVWAAFVQLNIPVFGDNNSIPLFRRLDLEASWRHDQYHGTLVGGTSNPKIGFTWNLSEDLGVTVRGGWGTSFRFANAGEYSVVASDAAADFGLPTSASPITISCGAGGTPPVGSVAAKLFATGLFPCGSAPPGVSWSGGPQTVLRQYIDASTGLVTSREGGIALAPESSTNWSLGGEFAPQTFLRGLDVQATWYSVKVNGTLLGFNNPTGTTLGNPHEAFHFIVPSDLGCPVAQNANPSLCAPFELMVTKFLQDPNNVAPASALTSIYWINDGGTVGTGFLKVQGVDWNASYDIDLGDLGAWNTGIAGTYYLHRYFVQTPGDNITDALHQNLAPNGGLAQNGVETLPRFKYRARLGWSNGAWSVTGFANYESHYFHTQSAPPNVNFQCTAAGGTTPGGTFPCLISNYTNIQPSWYTFDLSIGYDTGDTPANDYLKNIGMQVTIQNLMGIHPAFQYGPSNQGRTFAAFDILKSDQGRTFGVTLTKTW
jgi:iron complex outermembrane receptor protein